MGGFASGSILSFFTSPMFRIKQYQQITGYGFRQAAHEVLWENSRFSLRSCYAAIVPHYVSSTLGRSVYYAMYETAKRSFNRPVDLYERMACAALAGVVSWGTIFPLDSLRSRMYNQTKNLTTIEMAKVMYAEKAFFRGFWVTIFRSGPVAAAVLPVYD